MRSPASIRGYDAVYKTIHWLVFALITVQFLVGWTMPHIRQGTPSEGLVAWHMSMGAAILLLGFCRALWRLSQPVPPPLPMPYWQARMAHYTHLALYALVLAITGLGWAAASYFGFAVKLFGVIPLPALAAKGTEWAHTAGDIHNTLVYVLLAVVGLHVLGALYHQFVLRDRTLQRMLPGA